MEKLTKLEIAFKKFQQWGYNSVESAENAVREVFDPATHLHIYKDSFGDPSHIFYEDLVYIFGSGIYKKL